MTTTKLRVDMTQGIIEVEGNETFVLSIYNDFKEQITKHTASKSNLTTISEPLTNVTSTKPATKSESVKAKRKVASQTVALDKNLDLSGVKNGENLRKFYAKYEVKTNFEKNLIFIFYLQKSLKMTNINVDHVYTCYKEVGSKIPVALKQSLIDTSKRKAWIETASTDNLTVSTRGDNYMEHDFPKKEVAK